MGHLDLWQMDLPNKKSELKKHYETSTFMAVRPSDATNVVVSAPKRSQELSNTTNRVLLAQSAHRHYEYDSLSAKSSQALRI